MQYGIGENVGLTLRAQEVDIGCSEETAQQGPDENLGTDSIDTSTTAEDHDEGWEPFSCSSETASNVTVLEWRNLRTIDPAGTEPAEGKDDFVKNYDSDSSPVWSGRRLVGGQCC
jgi:hypothetical protein